jgi:hypothetical protein
MSASSTAPGRRPKADRTLVITDGKISAVGEPAGITIPAAARVIDLTGRSIMPGLVMLHEHLKFDPQSADSRGGFAQPQPFSAPRLYLAFGVTTIRTAGAGHPFVELNLKRDIDSGRTPGPEMFLTSPYFNGPDSPFLDDMIVRDGEDARRAVRYWAAVGFTSMKAYTALPKEALAAMIDEAHAMHLTVLAHLGQTVSCREAAELGIDSIEHGFGPCVNNTTDNLGRNPDGPPARALIELLIDRHVALTVTPAPTAPTLTDRQLELLHPTAREAYANEVKARPPAPPRAAPRPRVRARRRPSRPRLRRRLLQLRALRRTCRPPGAESTDRLRVYTAGGNSHRDVGRRAVSGHRCAHRQHCRWKRSGPAGRQRRSVRADHGRGER